MPDEIQLDMHSLRPYLFAIAYRMLGSVSDTEDILQEAFIRWQRQDRKEIEQPKAYLSRVVTRLCIEHLRKAYVRRESYVGPWLPEPLLTASAEEEPTRPDVYQERHEQLSLACMLMLESLAPVERAVFLLRHVFDLDYKGIAEIVGKTEANCRQLASRAKARLQREEPPPPPAAPQQQAIIASFLEHCFTGDQEALLTLMAPEVSFISDSDGKAKTARRVVKGADRCARLFIGLSQKVGPDITFHFAEVNTMPALVFVKQETIIQTLTFAFEGDRISGLYSVVNPDKLAHLSIPH